MSGTAIELAQKLIAVESLSPTHPLTPPEKANLGLEALKILMGFAKTATQTEICQFAGGDETYPQPVDNIQVIWKSPEISTRKLLYIGHVDVVPANADEWMSDPFKPKTSSLKLYGRGAVDMKGPVACFFAAAEAFATKAAQPYEVHALITTDEEWAAINGVDKALAKMKKQGLDFDAVLVGEPSSQQTFGDTIAIGRRGSFNLTITVKGQKGHRAYNQSFVNPVWRATKVIAALEQMTFITPSGWLASTDVQVINLRTDSESSSIVPGKVMIDVNFRFAGDETPASLLKKLEETLAAIGGEWEITPSRYPQAAYNGMPEGASPAFLNVLKQAIGTHANVEPQLTQSGGTSDGRYVQKYWPDIPVLEFGPLVRTMHQPNEHIPLDHMRMLYEVLGSTLQGYFGEHQG